MLRRVQQCFFLTVSLSPSHCCGCGHGHGPGHVPSHCHDDGHGHGCGNSMFSSRSDSCLVTFVKPCLRDTGGGVPAARARNCGDCGRKSPTHTTHRINFKLPRIRDSESNWYYIVYWDYRPSRKAFAVVSSFSSLLPKARLPTNLMLNAGKCPGTKYWYPPLLLQDCPARPCA